ncbi:hypothetical protein V8G54_018864 [Vigna mungo]|uniref:WAT1-related protein n=1 Tax=Vigna mungo TaxID=3915 RepID=A0AAQ3NBJ5_VIGMU
MPIPLPGEESEAEDDVFHLHEDSDSQPARVILYMLAFYSLCQPCNIHVFNSVVTFLCRLVISPNLYFLGMKYSTATFAVSVYNVLPTTTFVMAWILRLLPLKLTLLSSLTAWICLLGTVEGGIMALVMERNNFSAWSLKWDTKLLVAVYSGIVCSGLAYYIHGVVMKDGGPVFVTAFNPLCMVIVAIMGSFFLAEQMYLGRAIGAIVIIVGLYLVVWGKSKDYESSSKITEENGNMLSAKQTVERSNNKEEHFSNLGTIAGDEQV